MTKNQKQELIRKLQQARSRVIQRKVDREAYELLKEEVVEIVEV